VYNACRLVEHATAVGGSVRSALCFVFQKFAYSRLKREFDFSGRGRALCGQKFAYSRLKREFGSLVGGLGGVLSPAAGFLMACARKGSLRLCGCRVGRRAHLPGWFSVLLFCLTDFCFYFQSGRRCQSFWDFSLDVAASMMILVPSPVHCGCESCKGKVADRLARRASFACCCCLLFDGRHRSALAAYGCWSRRARVLRPFRRDGTHGIDTTTQR
jgi:hypothetical protein